MSNRHGYRIKEFTILWSNPGDRNGWTRRWNLHLPVSKSDCTQMHISCEKIIYESYSINYQKGDWLSFFIFNKYLLGYKYWQKR